MFHNDIMYSVMQERARELQAEARDARRAVKARKARKAQEEHALQVAAGRARRVRLAAQGR